MDPSTILAKNKGGFNFENVRRNELLVKTGYTAPGAKKTGTTICGLVYKDGVVLGADTRATEGAIVCDKACEKIHHISSKIWCCGAGTSADTESVTGLIASQLELQRLETGREPRVNGAMTRLKQRLFQHQGHISAALVLGGTDVTGSYVCAVYPHGSTSELPYATMGSGSLAAMAVFEAGYRDDMDEKEAVDLVDQAIQAGIFNDLGSGSNVDICVIPKDGDARYMRDIHKGKLNARLFENKEAYKFKKGSTEWLKETEQIFKHNVEVVQMEA